MTKLCMAILLVALVGCGPSLPESSSANPFVHDIPMGSVPNEKDAPEISRSTGEQGGVVVLWTRIAPRSDDPMTHDLAVKLQERMKGVVDKAASGRPIDVRPEPERVCPRQGCSAVAAGVLLTRKGDGCVATALVSGPGKSPARILPWGGRVKLKNEVVPFREPPESQIAVDDYVACSKLIDSLNAQEGAIVDYIKGLLP